MARLMPSQAKGRQPGRCRHRTGQRRGRFFHLDEPRPSVFFFGGNAPSLSPGGREGRGEGEKGAEGRNVDRLARTTSFFADVKGARPRPGAGNLLPHVFPTSPLTLFLRGRGARKKETNATDPEGKVKLDARTTLLTRACFLYLALLSELWALRADGPSPPAPHDGPDMRVPIGERRHKAAQYRL